MMESNNDLMERLNSLEHPHQSSSSSMPTFLAALCLGILLGLFFAIYLYKMKREKKGSRGSLPVVREFSEIIKDGRKVRKSKSLFSGSTKSDSDENNPHDTNAFI